MRSLDFFCASILTSKDLGPTDPHILPCILGIASSAIPPPATRSRQVVGVFPGARMNDGTEEELDVDVELLNWEESGVHDRDGVEDREGVEDLRRVEDLRAVRTTGGGTGRCMVCFGVFFGWDRRGWKMWCGFWWEERAKSDDFVARN